MNLGHSYTALTPVSQVVIPPIYYNRIKTGSDRFDEVFGGGILPGSTFCISAMPGTGKSTLLLQVENALSANYRVAHLSGEENIINVAMNARRIGALDVPVANENRMSEILKIIEDSDLVVIDSFPSIIYDGTDADELSDRQKDKQKLETIIECANKNECAVGFVLHMTKTGAFKGGCEIPHCVDAELYIHKDKENLDIRILEMRKNRNGKCDTHTFMFGSTGFDFETVVEEQEEEESGKAGGRKPSKNSIQLEQIMEMKEPPHVTLNRVCESLDIDAQRGKYLLWLLTSQGKLVKFGRGADTVWKQNVTELVAV